MRRPLITTTVGAALLAPGAALAESIDIFSPGITLGGMSGDGPMSGFNMGVEATFDRFRDGFLRPNLGALLQLEFDFAGHTRLNVGGQVVGPGFGAEVAWSVTFGAGDAQHGVMVNPFVGIGYVNAAWRNHFGVNGGYETGGALSLKVPLYDGEPAIVWPFASGRPLRDADGAACRPRVVALGRRPLPRAVADLPAASRIALGRAWLEDARDEHAAVDAFHRLARQLAARSAPRALVRRALRSARDETRHARDALTIAEALLGVRLALVSPDVPDGPLPDLARLAVESRLDGAIAEGAAARVAALGARRATVAPVTRLQSAIAHEEAGHAALGAAIERWAVGEGGSAVRAALAHTRAADPEVIDVGPTAPHGDGDLWRRWGRADAAERRAAWAAAS